METTCQWLLAVVFDCFVSVPVYQPFGFANKIGDGYNEVEISNKSNSNPNIYLFEDLVDKPEFQK